MCGICGIVHFEGITSGVDEPLLRRMTDSITHRGPDSDGTYLSTQHRVGLGFRRLAIVDLSPAGNQPMNNTDGSVWIVFNGEIYNHLKIREKLEKAGYSYKSRSDTETLIHAYEEYGPSFVTMLEGMFAIALWDQKKQKVFLFRDRIGIKPLYYTIRANRLVFASEIKAILQDPSIPREVDDRGISHYFSFISTPSPMTAFHGISKLEPARYLEISMDGTIQKQQYWSVFNAEVDGDPADEEFSARRIRELLNESIEKRMMSDVPFGVFLSGGIDSSTNVALMSRLMDRPVDTFSVSIRNQSEVNEFPYARKIAEIFKTNHHEIEIGDKEFIDFFPRLIYHHDEPLADPVSFPLYYVAKLARDNGTIVVQVGEGSDEQFCGYPLYARVLNAERRFGFLRGLPRPIRKGIYASMVPALKFLRVDYRQNYIKNLLLANQTFLGGAIAFDDFEKSDLLRIKTDNSGSLVDAAFAQVPSTNDYAAKMIYWEFQQRLPELLLMRVDKMTMATSIEARVPFLDHKLVEFSMKIPWDLKYRGGVSKYILKKAVRGIIPDEIIDRKKIGFAGSGKNMLTPTIFRFMKPILLEYQDPYTNPEYIRNLVAEYERTGTNVTMKLWALVNFKLWHKYWIAGESLS